MDEIISILVDAINFELICDFDFQPWLISFRDNDQKRYGLTPHWSRSLEFTETWKAPFLVNLNINHVS